MFIEQAYRNRRNLIAYLPFPLVFLGLMAANFMVSTEDTNTIIRNEIARYGKSMFFFSNLVPFAILMLLLFFWVKYMHRQSILSLTTSRPEIDWHRIFFSFLVWGGFSTLLIFISYQSDPESFLFNFNLRPFLALALISLTLIPFQTSFEEYLFRGYLMQGIGLVSRRKWVPLVATSVIFGLLHGANPEVEKMGYILLVYYVGTGFLLGIMTLMDDGMELSLGFHAANNITGALLVTSDWTVFQTDSVLIDKSEPSAGLEVIFPVLVIFPILLFIFSKKYQWSGWKEKLFGKIVLPPVENQNPPL
ncbi:CPBP family intramembrane metalloprotease domain-containing protein [Flavobacterium magnum]|uniref:CPBP family intramembrane metalloprotease domain-containing protein n=1 Tax=Flavobacterium magnum TaxID=2162713 RepID=A0A2S0RJI9_9FLAO|nr:CPBP family intramembrane glutamic endopeptidase [Flavobacterium magnum]AWA31368.1 CPBP family intramembrane metalloprotease domain-containing protein [Flavobacterium magnum]